MWQLSVRDGNREWTELGTFDGIGQAAGVIQALPALRMLPDRRYPHRSMVGSPGRPGNVGL